MVTDISTSGIVYNTGEKSRKQIDKEFIVRQAEFQMIMEDIKTSTMEFPEQEYLIIGEKGMGKTMLLTKLKYEIENDLDLKKWLIPVTFPEELNGALELFDLWVQVAEYLEGYTRRTAFEGLAEAILLKNGDEEQAFSLLNESLKKHKKKIILLIDNFGTFLNELNEKEDHRLREILITNANLRIVAANPEMVSEAHRYDKAFYEHFFELKLKGLDREQTKKLMLNLGKIHSKELEIQKIIKNEPYRINALRDFTGGNIRSIVMLFNILLSNKNQDPLSDLIQILDDVTPLNINRVAQLKKNQKKIINYIALQWDAVRTGEIAKALRMKSNEVSAQLNYLTENQWIVSKRSGRKNLYQLRDRFFNIWYLMRYDRRSERKRVKWLVHFYEIMCGPKQLNEVRENTMKTIDSENCPHKNKVTFATAIIHTNISDEHKQEVHKKLIDNLQENAPELINKVPAIEDIIKNTQVTKQQKLEHALQRANKIIYDKIEHTIAEHSENLIQKLKEEDIVKKPAEAYHILGHIYYAEGQDEWEDHFIESIKLGHRKAPFCLANCYYKNKEYKKADEYYDVAIKSKIKPAYLNAANLNYYYLKDYNKAESLLLEYTKKGIDTDAIDTLAHMYSDELNEPEKAVKQFQKAIRHGNHKSRSCLAWHYYSHNIEDKKKEAIKLVQKAFKKLEKPFMQINLAIIFLWNDLIEESINTAKNFLFKGDILKNHSDKILHFLMKLISKGQIHFVYNYLNDNENLNLKDRFKPLWYTVVYLLEGQHSEEYLRMGDELKETVESILIKIEEIKNP